MRPKPSNGDPDASADSAPAVDGIAPPAISQVMSPDARDLADARSGGPGAPAAFARLYDRHSAVVLALCRKHIGDGPDADDALQETFIRAFRMLDRLTDDDGVRSWLYAIARLVCSERRRAATRRRKHESHAAELAMHAATADNHVPGSYHAAESPGDSAAKSEQLARLGRALDELPDTERLAIHLFYLDADPVAAARDALGVSRSGFYKLLARARERLASSMSEARA